MRPWPYSYLNILKYNMLQLPLAVSKNSSTAIGYF
jgi:hypothetical protein